MLARRLLSLAILLAAVAVSAAAEPAAPRDRFGDPLPAGAIARLGNQRLRPQQAIVAGAFTPDRELLAASGVDGEILFWDTATGKAIRQVQVRLPGALRAMRFSADGKSLILAGDAGALRVVDAVTGEERRKLDLPSRDVVIALDVSANGKVAATIHIPAGTIHLWDLAAGKHLRASPDLLDGHSWNGTPDQTIALTPDGKQIVRPGIDGSLRLLDTVSGKEALAFEMPAIPGQGRQPLPGQGRPSRRPPLKVAVSPDGRYLAYAGLSNGPTLCDLRTGKRLRQLGQLAAGVHGLAFAPNSRFLAVCSHTEVYIFGIDSGKEIRRFSRPRGPGGQVAFSPDGRTLAMLGHDALVPLWDVPEDRLVCPVVGHQSPVGALAFFPDGKRLASAGRTDGLIVWDIATGQDIARHRNNFPFSAGFIVTDDGSRLQFVGLDRAIHRWNPASGDEEHQPLSRLVNFNHFTASPDGRTVVGESSGSRSQIGLYGVPDRKQAGRILALPQEGVRVTRRVARALFSPDSRRLATVSSDGILHLWDRDTGRLVDEWKPNRRDRLLLHWCFAGDGRTLALFDGDVRIREVPGGGDRLRIPAPGGVSALAYSADGRLLAVGHADGSIVVHGTGSGERLARWQGHQGFISALAFSGDGRRLASGGSNGTILVWQLSGGEDLPATVSAEQAVSFWQALVGDDAAQAQRALAGLAAAPTQALSLVKERFAILAKPPSAQELARLIARLDDDSFKLREQATRELADAGPDAAPALRAALADNPSPEKKRRLQTLLEQLSQGVDRRRLHCQRVIELLERIGTPPSRKLLRELAATPLSAELSEEVRASLRRLGDKP